MQVRTCKPAYGLAIAYLPHFAHLRTGHVLAEPVLTVANMSSAALLMPYVGLDDLAALRDLPVCHNDNLRNRQGSRTCCKACIQSTHG